MNKITVRDIEVTAKRVLVRVDFNVPVDINTGAITDDSRIRAALPTIRYLLERNARVILLSHMGRPRGKVVKELSLAPVARRLAQLLGQPVGIAVDCIGPEVEKSAAALRGGEVLLLENLRFHPEEEAGDSDFAEALARLGDIFVNDAFGTSHRAHASIAGITKYLSAVAGLLLEKEINTLGELIERPTPPFVAVFGGAKVSDKIGMLKNIMSKVACLLIGGGMAATFLKARSYETGESLVEEESVGTAAKLLEEAAASGVRILLPVDVVVTGEISNDASGEVVSVENIPQGKRIVDIGPETVEQFRAGLKGARTIFWNGPMGIEEIPQFAQGTRAIAQFITEQDATTVIGGGSTAETVYALGLADKITFISTGGGASLEFLGGKELPGVVLLKDK